MQFQRIQKKDDIRKKISGLYETSREIYLKCGKTFDP